jgi:hypothetical protein
MILKTFIPEITPASFVAYLCESLKYAGTVMTAFLIFLDKNASATSLIFVKTIAEISSGWNFLVSPLYYTTIIGLSLAPASTLKGQCFISS